MTDIKDLSKKLRAKLNCCLEEGHFPSVVDLSTVELKPILDELDRLIEVEKVLRKELEKISEDFGTDYCDGNCLGAHEALKRADEIGKM